MDPAAAVPAPTLTPVFDLDVEVAAAQELGDIGGGRRRVIPITGGRLRGLGPHGMAISGVILPGGADWQTLWPSGVTHLTARYTVQMSDGAIVGIVNRGVRRAGPDVALRMAAGEHIDPSLYYFRCAPAFAAGPGPHLWLTEGVFLGSGERHRDRVLIRVFRVD